MAIVVSVIGGICWVADSKLNHRLTLLQKQEADGASVIESKQLMIVTHELETIKQTTKPRHLSAEQESSLSKNLSVFAGANFQLQLEPFADRNEAIGIAQDIAFSLLRAGWKFDGVLSAAIELSGSGLPPAGIGISGSIPETSNLLVTSLKSVGVSAYIKVSPPNERKGDILIYVGRNPGRTK